MVSVPGLAVNLSRSLGVYAGCFIEQTQRRGICLTLGLEFPQLLLVGLSDPLHLLTRPLHIVLKILLHGPHGLVPRLVFEVLRTVSGEIRTSKRISPSIDGTFR